MPKQIKRFMGGKVLIIREDGSKGFVDEKLLSSPNVTAMNIRRVPEPVAATPKEYEPLAPVPPFRDEAVEAVKEDEENEDVAAQHDGDDAGDWHKPKAKRGRPRKDKRD